MDDLAGSARRGFTLSPCRGQVLESRTGRGAKRGDRRGYTPCTTNSGTLAGTHIENRVAVGETWRGGVCNWPCDKLWNTRSCIWHSTAGEAGTPWDPCIGDKSDRRRPPRALDDAEVQPCRGGQHD